MGYIEKVTQQNKKELHQRSNGERSNLPFGAFAIYACHQYSQGDHNEIAKNFGLTHQRGLSQPSNRIRGKINENKWVAEVKLLEKHFIV